MYVYSVDETQCKSFEHSVRREWLLTNGIGGFSMGTVAGLNSRRYHGLLVAAIEPPANRWMLLPAIDASISLDGPPVWLSTNQYAGAVFPEGYQLLERFTVSGNRACWTFKIGKVRIERRLTLHQGSNTVTVEYVNDSDRVVTLNLRPLTCHRSYHENFSESPGYPQVLSFPKDRTIIEHADVPLTLSHPGAERTPVQGWYYRFEHLIEVDRGLDPRDDLFCPCDLVYRLGPRASAVLVASADDVREPEIWSSAEQETVTSLRQQLTDAGEKLIVRTAARSSIIAGYPWFTDWGRDTMISLPGICLLTGKRDIARQILLDYASQMNQGVIPNRFTEGETPDYNTVDATLWFVNCVYAYLSGGDDPEFSELIREPLEQIYYWHTVGTHYGIKVDPNDGLLSQGQTGSQLTWMDAKVGDWVVTPRHGKPVEINGLWVNTLRILEWFFEKLGETSEKYRRAAEKAETSFNEKFWCESRGHYFDTVDPNDVSLRPNQVIAMSLPFGPAKGDRAIQALQVVGRELLTPVGLRTLGPNEANYRGRFAGPLPELDAAYHQGTVWPWLLGPYVTALVKLTGDKKEARSILKHVKSMIHEYGLGGIAEVYDGDFPQWANGCPWQAWSVAEILRAWIEDVGGD